MAEEFKGPVVVSGHLEVQPVQGALKAGGPKFELRPGEVTCELLTVTGSPTSQKFKFPMIDVGPPAAEFKNRVEIDGWLYVEGGAVVSSDMNVGGDIKVDGDIQFIGEDCAEGFDVMDGVDPSPGSVMVLEDSGALNLSSTPYDRRAVGVVSGAGTFRPGLILGAIRSESKRVPIGLIGKVFCKVDATQHPIEVGDLLTTSHVQGHAMKATNARRAFGSIIGKALGPLSGGHGLIPVFVCMQ